MVKVVGGMMLALLSLSLPVQAAPPAAKPAAAVSVNKDWKILLFTIPGCTSCQMMVNDVIGPMMETGDIAAHQFEEIVERSDADWQYVPGVGYKQIRELKKTYQTSLFPTLVMVDSQGRRLSDNLVGMTSVEHYRALLAALIQQVEARPR